MVHDMDEDQEDLTPVFLSPAGAEFWADAERELRGDTPDTPADEEESVVEVAGIYRTDEDVLYKVQKNREKTRLYAKRGVKVELIDENGDHITKWEWQYDRGAIYAIKARHLMTVEQVSEWGKLNDCCANCFKELTREESMDRGYGPTCATRYGWPYDHNRKG